MLGVRNGEYGVQSQASWNTTRQKMRLEPEVDRQQEERGGDESCVEGKACVWVICPECGTGRWVQKCIAKQIRFTGRCKKCYMEIARRNIGRYLQKRSSV